MPIVIGKLAHLTIGIVAYSMEQFSPKDIAVARQSPYNDHESAVFVGEKAHFPRMGHAASVEHAADLSALDADILVVALQSIVGASE